MAVSGKGYNNPSKEREKGGTDLALTRFSRKHRKRLPLLDELLALKPKRGQKRRGRECTGNRQRSSSALSTISDGGDASPCKKSPRTLNATCVKGRWKRKR
ncbi:unnamed protein product [Caenorhabditis sp. 36 PRJEB53466]|nr:unnamed protein product [Caenorhabditis sp. 36 PRJEB53466]